MRSRLIVFARYPEPGRAKTRLIPALGAEGAARLQHRMTLDTLAQVDRLPHRRPIEVEIRYAGGTEPALRGLYGPNRHYRPQTDDDLGRRLTAATAEAFAEGCERVAVIGTDCPGLTAEILALAFDALAAADVVLGPATDGGYYLIGLRRMIPKLFQDIPWSTDRTLAATLEAARRVGARVRLLVPLDDVDRPEDLRREDGAGVAPTAAPTAAPTIAPVCAAAPRGYSGNTRPPRSE